MNVKDFWLGWFIGFTTAFIALIAIGYALEAYHVQ